MLLTGQLNGRVEVARSFRDRFTTEGSQELVAALFQFLPASPRISQYGGLACMELPEAGKWKRPREIARLPPTKRNHARTRHHQRRRTPLARPVSSPVWEPAPSSSPGRSSAWLMCAASLHYPRLSAAQSCARFPGPGAESQSSSAMDSKLIERICATSERTP